MKSLPFTKERAVSGVLAHLDEASVETVTSLVVMADQRRSEGVGGRGFTGMHRGASAPRYASRFQDNDQTQFRSPIVAPSSKVRWITHE